MYQVVWQRILTTYYGVGATSVAVIVSIFMLGLGLGSLLGGQLAKRFSERTVIIYLLVEALIAAFGLVSLPALHLLGTYTSGATLPVYLSCTFCFLLVPTLLMGATLPLLTDILTRLNASFISTVSSLYCINTLGASFGAFFAAYVLISFWGLDKTVWTAVAINALLTLAVTLAAPRVTTAPMNSAGEQMTSETLGGWAYVCVFLTGFVAIGLEIVWFRTIELFVKSSPYAFASVLSIYLFGIAGGSWLMNRCILANPGVDKKRLFSLMQCSICAYVLLVYALTTTDQFKYFVRLSDRQELHPSFSASTFHSAQAFSAGWFAYFDIFIWPIIFMLFPTLLMGASFPLISLLSRLHDNASEAISKTYFFNIMGNTFGGIITGFVFLQFLGTAHTILALSSLTMPFFIMLIKTLPTKTWRYILSAVLILSLLGIGYFFPSNRELMEALHVPPSEEFRLAESGKAPSHNVDFFIEENSNCVDVAYQKGESVWHIINGLWHGGRLSFISGFYRRALEGLSYAQAKDNILVIGYGTGGIVEAILKDRQVKKLTLVELNSAVIVNLKKMEIFQKLLSDPRIELVIDDGRRYLLRTSTKYDAVFMDPLRSTTAYSNNVYSAEFFALVKSHLMPSGVMMVWLDNRDILPRTLASQFENIRLYESFCLASKATFKRDGAVFTNLLKNFDTSVQASILKNDKYLGDRSYIEHTLESSPVNTDLKPNAEYYLGPLVKQKLKRFLAPNLPAGSG